MNKMLKKKTLDKKSFFPLDYTGRFLLLELTGLVQTSRAHL